MGLYEVECIGFDWGIDLVWYDEFDELDGEMKIEFGICFFVVGSCDWWFLDIFGLLFFIDIIVLLFFFGFGVVE